MTCETGQVTTIEDVRTWLEWPDEMTEPLEVLEAGGRPSDGLQMSEADLRDRLTRLDVPPHTHDEIVETWHTVRTIPEALWLIERLYHQLTLRHGRPYPPGWPAPVVRDDPVSRYFHVFVFIASVPDVLSRHAERNIDPEITWETLRDLGLQVAHHQARFGLAGFDGAFWLWQHFRGEIFRLGRLQFNHMDLDGEPVLDTHIPALGPLTPQECDGSFDTARRFFPTHFPEVAYERAHCHSWLLDPQLAQYLPPSSNIVKFQERFTLDEETGPGKNIDVIRFAFGRDVDIDDIPQTTSVEKAIVEHIRSGQNWHFRRGWLDL
jgi:hypothetical protein